MTINIFEGARRILFAASALYVLVVLFICYADMFTQMHTIRVTLYKSRPDTSLWDNIGSCDLSRDATRNISRTTPAGNNASILLCFNAMNFDGRYLIPYRVDEKKMIYGNSEYHSDVVSYTATAAESFRLTPTYAEWIDGKKWGSMFDKFMESTKTAVLAIGGWFIVVLPLSYALGWIVRGFLGIPKGYDKRPPERAV